MLLLKSVGTFKEVVRSSLGRLLLGLEQPFDRNLSYFVELLLLFMLDFHLHSPWEELSSLPFR